MGCTSTKSIDTKTSQRAAAYNDKPAAKPASTSVSHSERLHTDNVYDVVTVGENQSLSCGPDKTIVWYDWMAKSVVKRWTLPQSTLKLCSATVLNGFFSASRDGIRLWTLGCSEGSSSGTIDEKERCIYRASDSKLPYADVVIAPDDNKLMVSGGRDYYVRFWDVGTATELGRCSESWNVITALKWVPTQPNLVAQASEDLSMRIWDTRTHTVAQKWSTDKYFPLGMDVSSDGNTVVTAHTGFDADGCYIKLWDRRQSGTLMTTLTGHSQSVYDVQYLPTTGPRQMLASSSKDQSLCIWDSVSGTQLGCHLPYSDTASAGELRCISSVMTTPPSTIVSAAPMAPYITLYSGSANGALQLWNIDAMDGSASQRAHTKGEPV